MAYKYNPLLDQGFQLNNSNALKKGDNAIKVNEDGVNITGKVDTNKDVDCLDVKLKGFGDISVGETLKVIQSQLNINFKLKGDITLEDLKNLQNADIGDSYNMLDGGEFTYKNAAQEEKTINLKPNDNIVFTDTGDWDLLYAQDLKASVEKVISKDGNKVLEIDNQEGVKTNCDLSVNGKLKSSQFAEENKITMTLITDDNRQIKINCFSIIE